MPIEERKVTREVVEHELRHFELEFEMPSSQFVLAFRNGRLHESPDFHRWAYLHSLLELFDRAK